jgi:hypothetical protein
MADLDKAVLAGDMQKQRDLVHRIDGSLCMLGDGWGRIDATRDDVVQQRIALLCRIDALETFVREMEKGSLSDDVRA